MEYRKLGHTDLDVGVIGLGTEYVYRQPHETLIAVVRAAIERGVARGLPGAHLGSTQKNGQYYKTRSLKRSEAFFLDLFARLGTDHADVLFLSNISSIKDLERVLAPGGLNDLDQRLRQEGRARSIGLSTHRIGIATQAVELFES